MTQIDPANLSTLEDIRSYLDSVPADRWGRVHLCDDEGRKCVLGLLGVMVKGGDYVMTPSAKLLNASFRQLFGSAADTLNDHARHVHRDTKEYVLEHLDKVIASVSAS